MKNRKLKAFKVMSTAALTSLVFTSLTAFADNNDITQTESKDEIVEQGTPLLVKNKFNTAQEDSIYKDVKNEEQTKTYKPDDLVHLIVELEQPAENEQTTPESKKALFKQKQDKVIEQISKEKDSKSHR